MFVSKTSFKTSWRRLQCNNFLSSKTSSRRPKEEKLLHWRGFEDVFKTCLEDVFRTSWRPTNVCRVTRYLKYPNFFGDTKVHYTSTRQRQNCKTIWTVMNYTEFGLFRSKTKWQFKSKINKLYYKHSKISNICKINK